jgi:hypothetical protein
MMPESWPSPLKLEVKISRTTQHSLSKRDLEGITPNGYAAVLITERLQRGPRWVLLPVSQLKQGGYTDAELCQLADSSQAELCRELNRIWSNWILDESVWTKLLAQDHMMIKAAIEWCLQQHPPRVNQSSGNLRENKLAAALQCFRAKLDEFLTSEKGPQQEGFIHQYLLAHALETIGYEPTVNPVGVPDISAVRSESSSARIDSIRERLRHWHPSKPELKTLRDDLLASSDDDLKAICRALTG